MDVENTEAVFKPSLVHRLTYWLFPQTFAVSPQADDYITTVTEIHPDWRDRLRLLFGGRIVAVTKVALTPDKITPGSYLLRCRETEFHFTVLPPLWLGEWADKSPQVPDEAGR